MRFNIFNILCLIFAVFIIGFIYFIRYLSNIMLIRLPENLYETNRYFIILIYLMLFVIFFYLLIVAINKYVNGLKKTNPSFDYDKYKKSIDFLCTLHANGITKFETFRCNNRFNINEFLFKITLKLNLFFVKYCFNSSKIAMIIILMNVIPKSIFLSAIIVDILFLTEFYYVYKVAYILLLPVIEKCIHYVIFEQFLQNCLDDMDDLLYIYERGTNTQIYPENYLNHFFMSEFDLESKNYPYQSDKFFLRHSTDDNVEYFEDVYYFFHRSLMPIGYFNFFYKAYKQTILEEFYKSFYMGYCLVWLYHLL